MPPPLLPSSPTPSHPTASRYSRWARSAQKRSREIFVVSVTPRRPLFLVSLALKTIPGIWYRNAKESNYYTLLILFCRIIGLVCLLSTYYYNITFTNIEDDLNRLLVFTHYSLVIIVVYSY